MEVERVDHRGALSPKTGHNQFAIARIPARSASPRQA
jgi:hypothetical protein